MFCSQCETQNDGDARLCQNCRAVLSVDKTAAGKCSPVGERRSAGGGIIKGMLKIFRSTSMSGPSSSDVKNGVNYYLTHGGQPLSWCGSMLGGTLSKIDLVEIAKEGQYNSDEKYGPYRIHVKGILLQSQLLGKPKQYPLTESGNFSFTKTIMENSKQKFPGELPASGL